MADLSSLDAFLEREIPRTTTVPTRASAPFSNVQEENAFQAWYKSRAQPLGLNPNPDDPRHQYDYRRAFLAGADVDPKSKHWPSKFKLANHPNRYIDGEDTITGQRAQAKSAAMPDLDAWLAKEVPPARPTMPQPTFSGGLPTAGIDDAYLSRTGRIAPLAEAVVGPSQTGTPARPKRQFHPADEANRRAKRAQIEEARKSGQLDRVEDAYLAEDPNSLELAASAIGSNVVAPALGLLDRVGRAGAAPAIGMLNELGRSAGRIPGAPAAFGELQGYETPLDEAKKHLQQNFEQTREDYLAANPDDALGALAIEAGSTLVPIFPAVGHGARAAGVAEGILPRLGRAAGRGALEGGAIGLGVADPNAPIGEQAREVGQMAALGGALGGLGGVREAARPHMEEPDAVILDGPEEVAPPGAPVPEEVPFFDRRQDTDRRARIDSMSPEERDAAVYQDPLTGLGNRRALNEEHGGRPSASLDLDSLKYINDTFGHEAGDELIRSVGEAIRSETEHGYRPSGDEFHILGDTEEEVQATLERVNQRLAGLTIELQTPDGQVYRTKPGVSAGVGANLSAAEIALSEAKAARQASGLRAARGERPPGMEEVQHAQTEAEAPQQEVVHPAEVEVPDNRAGDARIDDLEGVAPERPAGEPAAGGADLELARRKRKKTKDPERTAEDELLGLARFLARKPTLEEVIDDLSLSPEDAKRLWLTTKDWDVVDLYEPGGPAKAAERRKLYPEYQGVVGRLRFMRDNSLRRHSGIKYPFTSQSASGKMARKYTKVPLLDRYGVKPTSFKRSEPLPLPEGVTEPENIKRAWAIVSRRYPGISSRIKRISFDVKNPWYSAARRGQYDPSTAHIDKSFEHEIGRHWGGHELRFPSGIVVEPGILLHEMVHAIQRERAIIGDGSLSETEVKRAETYAWRAQTAFEFADEAGGFDKDFPPEAYKRSHWGGRYSGFEGEPSDVSPNAPSLNGESHARSFSSLGTPEEEGRGGSPDWLGSVPETKLGQKLVKLFDKKKPDVGVRSIVSMLEAATGAEVRVGREQLGNNRPAMYQEDPHLIRAKNAGDIDRIAHELGHGVSTLLRDAGGKLDKELIALTKKDDSIASAQTPEEGMAEWVRSYVQNPASTAALPVTAKIEAALQARKPKVLQALRDAARAYDLHKSRPTEEKFRSQNEARPTKPSLGRQFKESVDTALFKGASRRRGVHKQEDLLYGAYKGALGKKEGAKAAREALISARKEQPEADIEANYQQVVHIPEHVSNAIQGTGKRKGIYVVNDEGNFEQIFGKSVQNVVDEVGKKDWPEFVNYGNMKALLSRTKPEQDFPGRGSGIKLEDLADSVQRYEAANPEWKDRFKDIEHYNDALDQMVVQGGLKTAEEVAKIEKYEDYWPLLRRPERGNSDGTGSKTYVDPGLRRLSESGSGLPIDDLIKNLTRKTSEVMRAYYFKRSLLAPVKFAERIKASNAPQAVKAITARAVLELHPELEPSQKVGEVPAEAVKAAIAQARDLELWQEKTGTKITAKQLREMTPKVFEAKTKQPRTSAKDIAVWDDPIELWNRQSPADNALNVISIPDEGKRRYFQIEDPTLFNLYAGSRTPGEAAAWFGKVFTPVVKPWKEAIVNFPTFAIKNLPRDVIEATIMGHDPYHLMPHFYAGEHLLNKLTGRVKPEQETGAVASENMAETLRGRYQFFKDLPDVLKKGVIPEGYSEMSGGEKAMALPGQISSAVIKPLEVLLHVIGAPKLAEASEGVNRAGAFEKVKSQGGSDISAQVSRDIVTGNFGETAGNADLATYYRTMGFLNPSIQPTYEFWRRMTHPDPKVRLAAGTRLGVLTSATAAIWAINRLMTPEDKKEALKERTPDERFGYMPIYAPGTGVTLRIPFGPGAPGTWASFTWNSLDKISKENEAVGLSEIYTAKHILGAIGGIPGDPFSYLPPLPKTIGELGMGEEGFSLFRNKPIQPEWMSNLPNARDRSYPWTPEVYKDFADKTGISPLKTQYFVRSGIAAGYDEMAKGADMLEKGKKPQEPADIPLIGNLFTRVPFGWGSVSVQRVSEADKKWQLLNKKLDALYDLGRQGSPEYRKMEEALARLEDAHSTMKELKKLSESAKDAEEKGDMKTSRQIQLDMMEKAKLVAAQLPK